MKYTKKTIFALAVLMLTLTGCEDFLNKPAISDLSNVGFWKQEGDVKSWLAGTYLGIQSVLSENYLQWGEARSDNFYVTSYGNTQIKMNSLVSTLGFCNWEDLYKVINRCNVGIENTAKVPGMLSATTNSYLGQFYGIRALMYFYAIRIWGSVPLVTNTWNGDLTTKYGSRTDLNLIEEQILSDIDQAASMLDNQGVFYFNKGAALALKTDFLMYQKKYQEALDVTSELIKMSRYDWVKTPKEWRDIFINPSVSKETIFTLFWDYTANGKNGYGALVAATDKQPSYAMSANMFRLVVKNKKDVRFWGVLDTLTIYNAIGKHQITDMAVLDPRTSTFTHSNSINKFYEMDPNPYTVLTSTALNPFIRKAQNDCDFKLPIYRYADVMLMRAEALNKLDRGQEAIDIIVKVRSRCGNTNVPLLANYPVRDGYETNSLERLILEERQVEFYGEGKRWFDLFRTGLTKVVMDPALKEMQYINNEEPVGFVLGDSTGLGRILFPISNSAFQANPTLRGHQNLPYSE
ncbi:MAG TPA: RagB/SusD family nutrient uptake outer membrane protein [Bacteroidales bacterium]|nr:RagB/SusD family nutrient uptake outer membrane protein [Bacteroidales bacterium]